MSAALKLPAVLDLNAAAALRNDVLARAGAPLDLDASEVERVGGLCVQVLIAAANFWRATGHALRIVNATGAFRDDVRLLGVNDLLPTQDDGSAAPC